MNKIETFLKELSELTNKHGIAITGEGCDKPYLVESETWRELACELDYDDKEKKYIILIR